MDSIIEEDHINSSSTPLKRDDDNFRPPIITTPSTPTASANDDIDLDMNDTTSQLSISLSNSTLSRLTIDDLHEDSPSLNDDLYDTRSSLMVTSPNLSTHHSHQQGRHRRNFSFSSSSILTRHSFEDSNSISLGENKVSTPSISPLGQNSIYEIVSGADKIRRKQGKLWISVNNGTTKVSVRGPTTNDIPPVRLSKISKVPNNDLKHYMHEIYDDYKDFNSNRQLTQLTLDSLMKEDEFGGSNKQLEEDLAKIPDFYFDEDFQLDDPRVFSKMTENSDILLKNNDNDNSKALSNNNLLQEKLSWYLDTVEIHLIDEISKSSNSFFSALDDLKKITDESKNSGKYLDELDRKIYKLDTDKAQKLIKLMTKFRKRQNLVLLENSLSQLKWAMKLPDIAEDFFYKNQLDLSLHFIDLYYEVIHGNNDDSGVKLLMNGSTPTDTNNDDSSPRFTIYDISKLPALANLNKMVSKLRDDIGQSYIHLFVDTLVTDLRSHYESVSRKDALDRITFSVTRESKTKSKLVLDSNKINNSYQLLSESFTHDIPRILVGLLRSHNILVAFQVYQQKLVPELKNIIRDCLPNSMINDQDSTTSSSRPASSSIGGSGGSSGTGSSLGNDLRAMTPKEFEDMLVEIYTKLSECLRRLMTQQKFLLNLLLDLISQVHDPRYDEDPDLIRKLDISSTIKLCIDKTQERMAKIITVRREQTIKLTVPFFLKFYSVNNLFCNECESISGSTSRLYVYELVQHYTKQYIYNFPNLQTKYLMDSLDRETWKDLPLPMSLQNYINEIVESAQDDPVNWLDAVKYVSENGSTETSTGSADSTDESDVEQRKTVIIDEKSFIVPSIANQIFLMIKDFLLLKTIFGQNAIQLQHNLIDLLKKINQKINQQVLGANVKRTTSLKHITSKHLAITSQLLASIIALIPYIQKSFERSLKPQEVAGELFGSLLSDYKDHQSQIYAKLISLMSDRVQLHCRSIASIDWSEPVKDKSCYDYMESLVKETTTISRVLQRYLPEVQVSLMLSQIFDNYKTHLINEYSKLQIKDSVQKLFILKDIDYFRVNLSDLMGYGQSGQMIWETVNSMEEKEG